MRGKFKIFLASFADEFAVNFPERRQATRFKGKLRVELKNETDITRDFSASGIFFETDRSFSTGESVEFVLGLEHMNVEHFLSLKCRGEVVRVE